MSNSPNLVYIFPDQYRQQAVGCMNQDPVSTPNLDRLASTGKVLTHAISNFPVCSPYRAMLFTGQYPFTNGVYGNCYNKTAELGIELNENAHCFSDVLHDNGYDCGYIGKLHLDSPREENIPYTEGWRGTPGEGTYWDAYTPPGPRRHGFSFWHSYGCCDQHITPHYWENDAAVNERIDVQEWSVKHETDVAIDFIKNTDNRYRDKEKPFALFVAYNPPHTPFNQVPDTYREIYADSSPDDLLNRPNVQPEGKGALAPEAVADYFAAVTGIDENIGRILDRLDAEGEAENTIVIFTSDHGEMMGSHGRMHKNVWYNESMLVPFIIRWPERIQPGTDDLLLSVPDIMPSLLNLLGLQAHIPETTEGLDLGDALLDKTADRPESAFYMNIIPFNPAESGARGIRTHQYMYAVQRENGTEKTFLFDCQADPYQLNNIAADKPAIMSKLESELQQRLSAANDPWLEYTAASINNDSKD